MLNSPIPPRLEDAVCLTEAECLLIDPRARSEDLFDQCETRLEAASNLMMTLSTLDAPGACADVRDLANVALSCRLLLADSLDLLMAARVAEKRQQAPARKGGAHA
ncbi:hypothetical protein B0H98_101278 [Vreelandella songnenensis]|uniref:Uncharacterized protein n=1 Tax=Vreelandella songnenensis TaxID=1176243 RepID=A0A2T0V7Z5_9GAMM|nr:hypothetical protein [Halomonas songnenensis]PRY66300.1 hypothetical protein B0H98_101278 [Halomonas songnenensis]